MHRYRSRYINIGWASRAATTSNEGSFNINNMRSIPNAMFWDRRYIWVERDITFKVLTQILSVNCQFSFDIGNKGASDISNSYWRLSLIVQCGQVGISKKFRGRSQQNVFIRLLKASRETWEVFPFSFKWYHSTLHGEKFSGLSIFKTWWARWEESGSLRTMIIVSLSAVAFFLFE